MLKHYDARMQISLGDIELAVQQRLRSFTADRFNTKLWEKNPTLWSQDPTVQKSIQNCLGWLTVYEDMKKKVGELLDFSKTIQSEGFTDVVLIGMGGSSLCPEVLRASFPEAQGLALHIIDTTDADQLAQIEKNLNLSKTLVLVSSKSGSTIEVESLYAYFRSKIPSAKQFITVTDPESPLHKLAEKEAFRRIFLNPSDIGGRFSALSYFGLVPAALLGVNIDSLLQSALDIASISGPTISDTENVALILGTILGEAYLFGRDKLTLIASPEISSVALWIEQLVAESTGKNGQGILPVVEKIPAFENFGAVHDRIFVLHRLQGGNNQALEKLIEKLSQAHLPHVVIDLHKKEDLGGLFLWWELATAVAGHMMQIQPFDQPNVQESKLKTAEIIKQGSFSVSTNHKTSELPNFLDRTYAGDYIACLAFLPINDFTEKTLEELRIKMQQKYRRVSTVGFGPRYLHSTGQLHKGDASKGAFIVITADRENKIPVPGKNFSFNQLQVAQALGDIQALQSKGRRILHLHLNENWEEQLREIPAQIQKAISIPVIN